jgi:purine-nucleoside phosphorylase
MAEDIFGSLQQARNLLIETWGTIKPHTCLVCGSGWGEVVQSLSPVSSLSYDRLIGMGKTTIEGHRGNLWLARPDGKEVLIFQGRRHFYEGVGWGPVVFPALLAHEMGVGNLLLTNASGGISEHLQPGDFMVLTDHLNFMGSNPLIGPNTHPSIPRFPDQSEIYRSNLQEKIIQAGQDSAIEVKQGIYVALSGPAFETPAEILAYQKLGGDAVGMSTVPEAMVGNGLGLEVGAISCISNLAAGRSPHPLSHEEVTETSQEVFPKMAKLLANLLPTLG